MAFSLTVAGYDAKIWSIPTSKPKVMDTSLIRVLQADGDELERIRITFSNVPITKGNICIWRGAMAEFIFENLK